MKVEVSKPEFDGKIENLYCSLVQIREQFKDAAVMFRDIQKIAEYISSVCRKPMPADSDCDSPDFGREDVSDEAITISLANAMHNRSGIQRCVSMAKLIAPLADEVKSFSSKEKKLRASIKLMREDTEDDRIMKKAQIRAASKVADNLSNRRGKLSTILMKYLEQRKANINRQLGIDERVFELFKKSGMAITSEAFKRSDIVPVFEAMKVNDERAMKCESAK